MKILLIADVHNRPKTSKLAHNKTLKDVKKAIDKIEADLIVFLGDTVHGPDFKEVDEPYEPYLREVLDLTGNKPFAYLFGNHDDECDFSKEQILEIVNSYPNSITNGRNYVHKMCDETLLFIDSGSYYETDESLYDVVPQNIIDWAENEIKGKKAIAFQHIIVPDIMKLVEKRGRLFRFKKGIKHSGYMLEKPCPPDIMTNELSQLAPYLKGMVFGHDHVNSFELELNGVKLIQCEGAGYNCYDKHHWSSVKLLDTKTMITKKIKL